MNRRNFLKLVSAVPFFGLIPAKKVVAKKLDWRTLTFMKCHKLSTQYPGNVGVIFRDNWDDLKQTMDDFTSLTGTTIDIPSKSVIYPNGSRVAFLHSPVLYAVGCINLGWFFIDHGDLYFKDNAYLMLRVRLRRKGVPIHWFYGVGDNGHRFCRAAYQ